MTRIIVAHWRAPLRRRPNLFSNNTGVGSWPQIWVARPV